MTTKDRTGDRLVASIRRTRAGAEKPEAQAAQAAADKDSDKAGGKVNDKPATPRRRTGSGKPRSSQRNRAAPDAGAAQDSYRSVKRVWPD